MLASLHTFKIVTLTELLLLVLSINNRIGTSIQKHCLSKCISALLLFFFSYMNDKYVADAVLKINTQKNH